MSPSRCACPCGAALLCWAALAAALVGCDRQPPTGPGARPPSSPAHFIAADTDTTSRSYTTESCTEAMGGTENHCAYVVPLGQQDVDMMWTAVDETTCPDVWHILNSQMMHGRIQKVDLQRAVGSPYIFGFSHRYPDPAHLDWSRMHLDAGNAFTSQGSVSITMRHEVMHYLHPEITDEDQLDTLAGGCGPH